MAQFMTTYAGDQYKGWNGIIYIMDTSGSASPGARRGVRIWNAAKVPPTGYRRQPESGLYPGRL